MNQQFFSRRELIQKLGGGIAGVALADLMNNQGLLAETQAQSKSPLAPKLQHFAAKAKAVISIFCYGGVSQVDTFDPKPALLKYQGETMTGVGEVRATMGTPGGLMPSPWQFKKHGQSGMEISELFPHVAQHADDLALIRSMTALSPAHGPAIFQMSTGSILAGLVGLVLIIPNLAVAAKRWHDRDKSGWWMLIALVPIIGWIWALVETGFLAGTSGPNRFGADPG